MLNPTSMLEPLGAPITLFAHHWFCPNSVEKCSTLSTNYSIFSFRRFLRPVNDGGDAHWHKIPLPSPLIYFSVPVIGRKPEDVSVSLPNEAWGLPIVGVIRW